MHLSQPARQIFSTDKYIFKITETFEILYKIGYHQVRSALGDIHLEADSKYTYSRIWASGDAMRIFCGCEIKRYHSFTEPFHDTKWTAYKVVDPKARKCYGYKLVPSTFHSGDEKHSMYFVLTKKS